MNLADHLWTNHPAGGWIGWARCPGGEWEPLVGADDDGECHAALTREMRRLRPPLIDTIVLPRGDVPKNKRKIA